MGWLLTLFRYLEGNYSRIKITNTCCWINCLKYWNVSCLSVYKNVDVIRIIRVISIVIDEGLRWYFLLKFCCYYHDFKCILSLIFGQKMSIWMTAAVVRLKCCKYLKFLFILIIHKRPDRDRLDDLLHSVKYIMTERSFRVT